MSIADLTDRNDGGQAYPNGNIVPRGMTLRDYFAAMQMNRIASGWPNAQNMQRIAADCYAMADAMLAERSK